MVNKKFKFPAINEHEPLRGRPVHLLENSAPSKKYYVVLNGSRMGAFRTW